MYFILGSFNGTQFAGGSNLMQIYGKSEGISSNSALFGLVSYNNPCLFSSLSGNFDSLLVTTEQKLSVLERGEVSRQKFERLGKMNRSFDEHTPRSLTYSNP